MAPLVLAAYLATRLHNLRCHIALDCPIGIVAILPWIALLALSVSIALISLSARVNSVKFHKGVLGKGAKKLTNVSFMYVCVAGNGEMLVFFSSFFPPTIV